MTYNFSEELKRNISMEHRRHSGVSHAGVTETLVEFERQYVDIHASLESLNRAETHVQSLESIVVSLEAIKESTRGEKSVALVMANISLEAVEHSFELPTRTVAVSLEDGEPEEQTTTMVNKIKGALAVIKDSAVQVLGQIGQNLQALLGSVIAGATKFKSKLAGLKSQAGNAQGGQELSLGGTANMLTVGGGQVNGSTYLKDLAETMKILGTGLATFKDADELAVFGEGLLASSNGGAVDPKPFVKKAETINSILGKKGLGGGTFSSEGATEAEVKEFIEFCVELAKREDAKNNGNTPSVESLTLSLEEAGYDVPEQKRAIWKKLVAIYIYFWGGIGTLITGVLLGLGILSAGIGNGIIVALFYACGYRAWTGKWPSFGLKKGMESYSVSMESLDVDYKAIAALSQLTYLVDDAEFKGAAEVTSLDGKQASQVTDMLTSLCDSTIAYAKSLKDRKAVVNNIGKGLKELTKSNSDKKTEMAVKYVNDVMNKKFKNIVAFETSVNKYALNVLRAGVAYVEASVNTKAVETPAE